MMTCAGYAVLLVGLAPCLVGVARAATGNIDPNDKWAWGINVGWINFDPPHGGVTIDMTNGEFDGYAWAETIGWIHFNGTAADFTKYKVVAWLFRVYLPIVNK